MSTVRHSHRRRRTTLAAIAGILIAATLTAASCSTDTRPPALTQVDATARLEAHFADAGQALQGQATLENDDRLPPYQALPCDDNDLRSDPPVRVGRSYFIVAAVPESAVISTLHQYWLSKGWKDADHADSFAVGVTSPDGYSFYVGKQLAGLTISGEAPCAVKTP